MSRPAIRTSPLAGSTSRISILISVDLPQPVGPTTKANSPRSEREGNALDPDMAARVDNGGVAQLDDRRPRPVAVGGRVDAPRPAGRLVSGRRGRAVLRVF